MAKFSYMQKVRQFPIRYSIYQFNPIFASFEFNKGLLSDIH